MRLVTKLKTSYYHKKYIQKAQVSFQDTKITPHAHGYPPTGSFNDLSMLHEKYF
jgi:hypothetical protein